MDVAMTFAAVVAIIGGVIAGALLLRTPRIMLFVGVAYLIVTLVTMRVLFMSGPTHEPATYFQFLMLLLAFPTSGVLFWLGAIGATGDSFLPYVLDWALFAAAFWLQWVIFVPKVLMYGFSSRDPKKDAR